MAKAVADDVLDGALAVIRQATRMVAVAGQPANYTAANNGRLVDVALVAGDYTVSDGTVNGRRVAIGPKNGVNVFAAGTADHIALLDGTRLLYVTTCPTQALVAGGTVNFAGWDIEIGDPT